MVNDAETTRKKLTAKLDSEAKMIVTVSSKKNILRIITAVLVLGHLVYYYLTRKVVIAYILYTAIPIVVMWLIYGLSLKYL